MIIQFIVELLLRLKREIKAMATRFTNLEFYATTTNGKRRPVATNIDETPTDIENPDPGGDGGGGQNPGGDQGGGDQGTGGDIGNPSGSASTTLGDAPTLSRKNHEQDVFVQQGSQFSITYVASGPCTILPKKGFNDMDVTYSDDGLEMTLTYTPPITMPGDSYYIGAEAHVYGGDAVEAINDIYDIVHVGKSASDIVTIGLGTSHAVIQDALESSSAGIQSGSTVIIEPGLYNNARDYITIGGTPATAITCPNGAVGGVVTKIVYGPDATTPFQVNGEDMTETFKRTSKYTTIMAREPYKTIIDRNNQLVSDIRLIGNERSGSSYGFHEVFGIAVKGLAFRNSTYGASIYRVDSCKITDCSFINSITAGQYSDANGGAHAWFADGGIVNSTSTRNCTVESITAIYNTRAGLNTGTGGFYNPDQHLLATQYCIFRNMMLTHGCYQPYAQHISQTFLGYGARYVDVLNCWAIDSSFFRGGIRTSPYNGVSVSPNDHFSFQITNGSAEQFRVNRFLALKDTRGGIKLDQNNTAAGRTTFNECVFWDKVAGVSQNGMMDIRSWGQIDNCTLGKVEDAPGYLISSELELYSDGILILNPEWDYNYSSNPTLFLQPFNLNGSADNNYCLVSSIDSNSKIESLTDSLTISRANTKSSGAQYIGRIDDASTIGQFGAGCKNIFAAEGKTGYEHVDEDYSVFDGKSGRKYVNPYSRECWRQWRTERQTYNTTIDGTTYTGAVGVSVDGVIPTDYINRQGTSPDHPINAPFIDDIYGYVVGSTAYIKWRPVCAAFRSTITGYNFYIDGILVGSNQAKEATGAQFDSVASGVRLFNIEVIDPTHGNSGMSRTVYLTIP